jgi:hypothetical protein
MSFRGYEPGGPTFVSDPFERFIALDAALEALRGVFADQAPQRLAAIALVLIDEPPETLAAQIHALSEALGKALPWYSAVTPQFLMVLAAVVRRRGDEVPALTEQSAAVGELMRQHGMRWAPSQSLISAIALRMQLGAAPISPALIDRMREIWDHMRRHHPWLTGADDWPSCALLATRPGTPAELALRAHEIYEALREHAGGRRGQSLQAASNMLALVDATPTQLAERYAELRAGFEAADISVSYSTYADVAGLCLLPRAAKSVVEMVVHDHARLCEHLRWHEQFYAFGCACNLALIHAAARDEQLGALVDVKLLLDIQQIIWERG